VTPTVEREFKGKLTGWFELAEPDKYTFHAILQEGIDEGEASAIALSLKLAASVVVIDDLKGRNKAEKSGITYTGTFGLILKARQSGIIENVRPILSKIQATNFRYDPSILKVVLKYSGD
jgi:predicted nucleic acid-binding protein